MPRQTLVRLKKEDSALADRIHNIAEVLSHSAEMIDGITETGDVGLPGPVANGHTWTLRWAAERLEELTGWPQMLIERHEELTSTSKGIRLRITPA